MSVSLSVCPSRLDRGWQEEMGRMDIKEGVMGRAISTRLEGGGGGGGMGGQEGEGQWGWGIHR